MVQANEFYLETWKDKDESMNQAQGPYVDMIEAEKTREVEDEVRLVVDHTLRGIKCLLRINEIFLHFH